MEQRWSTVSLGEKINVQTGYPFESERYTEKPEDIRLLRGANISQGKLDWGNEKRWPASGLSEVQEYLLDPGDVILAMDRPWIEAGLKFARITSHHTPCLLVQRVARLTAEEDFDQAFLKYVIQHHRFTEYVKSVQTGSAVPHISAKQIRNYEFRCPPLPVQRRIADILGALDDKIELNRRMNETLEEMAQALYYHLFNGSVGGDGARLDELVNIKPRMPVPDDDEVLTYVGMADVEPNRMSITDYGQKEYTSGRRFINGDTLMARITPSLENGKTAFVDFLDEGEMAFGSTEFTVMRAEEGTSPYFVYCCARDDDFREYAISTMTGSSGRQRVQENLLGEYAFEDYSQEDMGAFHEKAEPLFKLIGSNTSENRTLAETRDYLLPKLISGEIEVEAAQKAAADAVEASA